VSEIWNVEIILASGENLRLLVNNESLGNNHEASSSKISLWHDYAEHHLNCLWQGISKYNAQDALLGKIKHWESWHAVQIKWYESYSKKHADYAVPRFNIQSKDEEPISEDVIGYILPLTYQLLYYKYNIWEFKQIRKEPWYIVGIWTEYCMTTIKNTIDRIASNKYNFNTKLLYFKQT